MPFRRIMLSVAAAATLIVPLLLAVPAQAAGDFYMQLKGTSLYIVDTGHNSLVEMGGAFTYYTEISEGGGWFELEDNSGLCLNIGTNEYAYSDGCDGATTEQFYKSGYQFENRHYGILLNANPASGSDVFLANDSGNADAQWSTPQT